MAAGPGKNKGIGGTESAREAARRAEEASRLARRATDTAGASTTPTRSSETAARVEGKIKPMPILDVGPKPGKSAEKFGETAPVLVTTPASRSAATPTERQQIDTIKDNIRGAILTEAQAHNFRNSPTAPTRNIRGIPLAIDTRTGEIVNASHPGQEIATFTVYVDFSRNRITLPQNMANTSAGLDQSMSPGQRAVMRALAELDGSPVALQESAFAPQLEAAPNQAQVMPTVTSAELASARAAMTKGAAVNATIRGSGALDFEIGALANTKIGVVYLDAEGRVVGSEFARPAAMSPRGTTYKQGIQGAGTPVPVVMSGKYLLQFENTGLNDKQLAVMQGLQNESTNQDYVTRSLRERPYLMDMTFGTGMAPVLRSLSFQLAQDLRQGRTDCRLALVRDRHGNLTFKQHDPDNPDPNRLAVVDFHFMVRSDVADTAGTPGQLVYEIVEGTIPKEVTKAVHYAQRRAELPFNELVSDKRR